MTPQTQHFQIIKGIVKNIFIYMMNLTSIISTTFLTNRWNIMFFKYSHSPLPTKSFGKIFKLSFIYFFTMSFIIISFIFSNPFPSAFWRTSDRSRRIRFESSTTNRTFFRRISFIHIVNSIGNFGKKVNVII